MTAQLIVVEPERGRYVKVVFRFNEEQRERVCRLIRTSQAVEDQCRRILTLVTAVQERGDAGPRAVRVNELDLSLRQMTPIVKAFHEALQQQNRLADSVGRTAWPSP